MPKTGDEPSRTAIQFLMASLDGFAPPERFIVDRSDVNHVIAITGGDKKDLNRIA
jgi:hypothetical protein